MRKREGDGWLDATANHQTDCEFDFLYWGRRRFLSMISVWEGDQAGVVACFGGWGHAYCLFHTSLLGETAGSVVHFIFPPRSSPPKPLSLCPQRFFNPFVGQWHHQLHEVGLPWSVVHLGWWRAKTQDQLQSGFSVLHHPTHHLWCVGWCREQGLCGR